VISVDDRGVRAASLVILCVATTAAATPNRAEFAKALAKVKPGQLAKDVRARLGAPDDVKTEHDPGGITASRTTEVWRYGARGHLAFATLGTIHVQADGKVQYVFGDRGAPPVGFGEADLRRLLELIDAVPSYNAQLDPLALIRAVDALQPLGKERALAAIDEYLRVSSSFDDGGREGVFLLLRALFDVPAAGMPPMMVGGAQVPTDPAALPRFPLAIVDDVPLKLISGYSLAGEAEAPETDVAVFRKLGTLRAKPLAPSGGALDAIHTFVEGPLVKAMAVDDNLRVSLYDQALSLTATVAQPSDASIDGRFPYGPNIPARWAARRAEVAKQKPVWDAAAMQLTLPGGATLPAPAATHFQRVWWDLALAGTTKARLTFERKSDAIVEVELRLELTSGAKLAAGTIRLVDPTTGKELGQLAFAALAAPATSTMGSVMSQRLALPHGLQVRPEHGTTPGPVLVP
jgi:hypothetical protein